MTAAEGSLHTLDYRIDIAELGDLALYPLTPEFTTAWDSFTAAVKRRAQRDDITPSYSHLATALTAVTGQPVRLFPSRDLTRQQSERGIAALLVTTGAIQPGILATAAGAFERMSLGDGQADTLAPSLAGVMHAVEPLAKYVSYEEGTIRAPGWVYEVARWNLGARLVKNPVLIDGHLPIRLRLDTDGNLLAWDHPITRAWNTGPCHAMIYISSAVVTLPGAAGLYLRLDAHVARQPLTWWGVRNAWIDPHHAEPGKPLLRLPVYPAWPEKGREHPQYGAFAAAIVQECQLNPIPILPDESPRELGPVRLIGKPRKHPVGKGPGARLMFQLHGHALEGLSLPDLTYRRTKIAMPAAGTGILPAAKIDNAITVAPDDRSRIARLRIVCLYDTELTRHRMTDALAHYSASSSALAGIADDQPVKLTDRLTVLVHREPQLLAHGQHPRNLDELTCLTSPEDGAVIALVETLWEPGSAIEDDAKPLLRAALGKRGVVAQFLNAGYVAAKPRRAKDGAVTQPRDHPAEAAVRDLLRQAGLNDNRLAAATGSARLTSPLTRAATLVGVHIRQHTPRRRNGRNDPNRLVVQLVAVHATPDDAPWAVQMYDDAEGWISYREANARYYATDIGKASFGRSRDKAPLVREYVDQALAALPKTRPLVVFVDAGACRGIWPGLNNSGFAHSLLPGSASSHPDLAVVRCASGENVPRPTHRSHGLRVRDRYKPDLPRTSLYEHDEGGVRSWLLAQPSRVHRSAQVGARAGTDYTRWTLPDTRETWMARDWHALTAIEIAIAQPGSWRPDELAALAARLCHQAASWDDRTLLPVPLHLAKASDQDHPGHPPDDE
jgi:hypothetical protein